MLKTDYNLIPIYNMLTLKKVSLTSSYRRLNTCLKFLKIPQSNFAEVQLILNIFHTYALTHDFK